MFAPLAIWPVAEQGSKPGRIHEHEARLVDRLGVLVDGLKRRRPALHRRSQRLLEDVRDPALLVSRDHHTIHLALVPAGVFLPPLDAIEQLLPDFGRDRSAREHVLDAVDLRRLGQNRRSAVANEDIHRGAERGIGRDAGKAVRSAALEPDLEMTGGNRLARTAFASGSSSRTAAIPASMVARVPPVSCMIMVRSSGPSCRFCDCLQIRDLIALAPQPDKEHRREVGMARVSRQRSSKHIEVETRRGHPATGVVRECDDTVHIRDTRPAALA